MTEKDQFLTVFEKEFPTTLKVLKAYPATQPDFKPHEKSRSAKELAWVFVIEQRGMDKLGLKGEFDPSIFRVPPPDTMNDVIATYEREHKDLAVTIRKTPDAELNNTVQFLTGPGKMGEVRRLDFLWFVLMDSVHHRGQFSVYLRMAGGKVPSIYGPTADEKWM